MVIATAARAWLGKICLFTPPLLLLLLLVLLPLLEVLLLLLLLLLGVGVVFLLLLGKAPLIGGLSGALFRLLVLLGEEEEGVGPVVTALEGWLLLVVVAESKGQ
jgi:hypothetical protein